MKRKLGALALAITCVAFPSSGDVDSFLSMLNHRALVESKLDYNSKTDMYEVHLPEKDLPQCGDVPQCKEVRSGFGESCD